MAQKELRPDAPLGPDVDGCGVVCAPEDELRGPVVPATSGAENELEILIREALLCKLPLHDK